MQMSVVKSFPIFMQEILTLSNIIKMIVFVEQIKEENALHNRIFAQPKILERFLTKIVFFLSFYLCVEPIFRCQVVLTISRLHQKVNCSNFTAWRIKRILISTFSLIININLYNLHSSVYIRYLGVSVFIQ